MPLNEYELRAAFEKWFGALVPLLRDRDGNYVYMAAHSAWMAFKAAYSPEVLQALGVAMVPISEPNEVDALKAALNFNLTDAKRYRTLRDEALHFSFEDSARESAWIVLGTDCKDSHPTFMGNEIDDVVDAMIEALKEQS